MCRYTGSYNYFRRVGLKVRDYLSNNSGATTLEFTFFITSFLVMLFFFLELCRVIFISAALDLAVAESGRAASFDSQASVNYRDSFTNSLKKNSSLWPYLGNDNDITIKDVRYCLDVEQLVNNTCSAAQTPKGSTLAIYSIEYNYNPVLANVFMMDTFKKSMLQRDVVYVQQYELVKTP